MTIWSLTDNKSVYLNHIKYSKKGIVFSNKSNYLALL